MTPGLSKTSSRSTSAPSASRPTTSVHRVCHRERHRARRSSGRAHMVKASHAPSKNFGFCPVSETRLTDAEIDHRRPAAPIRFSIACEGRLHQTRRRPARSRAKLFRGGCRVVPADGRACTWAERSFVRWRGTCRTRSSSAASKLGASSPPPPSASSAARRLDAVRAPRTSSCATCRSCTRTLGEIARVSKDTEAVFAFAPTSGRIPLRRRARRRHAVHPAFTTFTCECTRCAPPEGTSCRSRWWARSKGGGELV